MSAPITLSRIIPVNKLRPAGLWLLVLMGLVLLQPLLGMAGDAPGGANRQLEFTATDFSAELLDSPAEHFRGAKQSLNCPESESIASRFVPADQLLSNRPYYLRIAISSTWSATTPPLFLPRPPPHS